MIIEVEVVNFRRNLGEMLNRVQYRNDSIVINNKDDNPVAVLVDAELFAPIQRLRDRFDALTAPIVDSCADVPVDEGLVKIDAADTKL